MCHPTDVGHDSLRSDKKARTVELFAQGLCLAALPSVQRGPVGPGLGAWPNPPVEFRWANPPSEIRWVNSVLARRKIGVWPIK
jgi:hypothetical protein